MPAMLYIILGGILMGLGYRQLAEEDQAEQDREVEWRRVRCDYGHGCCREIISKGGNHAEAS